MYVVLGISQYCYSLHVYLLIGHASEQHGSKPQEQLDTTLLHHKASIMALLWTPEPPTQQVSWETGTSARSSTQPLSQPHNRHFCYLLHIWNITYSTNKVYMSAIRHLNVTEEHHKGFCTELTPRMQLILKGIQKSQATSHAQRPVYPSPWNQLMAC